MAVHFLTLNTLKKQLKNPLIRLYPLEDLYTILGHLFLEKQDNYGSLMYLQYSLDLQLKRAPQGDWKSINTYAVMVNVYVREGQFDLAAQNYRQALYLAEYNNFIPRSIVNHLKDKLREILFPII